MKRISQVVVKLIPYAVVLMLTCIVVIGVLTLIGPPGNLTSQNIAIIRQASDQAHANWSREGVLNYDIDVDAFLVGCNRIDSEVMTLYIRNGRVVSARTFDGKAPSGCPSYDNIERMLPPKLYDTVQEALDRKYKCINVVEVTFEANYGYASSVHLGSTICGHSQVSYKFSNFKPMQP